MADQKELFKAIKTRFDATDAGTNITGGLWFGTAPQDTSMPYAVFNEISDVPEYTFTSTIETRRIQFSIFTNGQTPTAVKDLYDDMITAYDDHILSITGYTTVVMYRDNGQLLKDPENNYWQQIIDYIVEFHVT